MVISSPVRPLNPSLDPVEWDAKTEGTGNLKQTFQMKISMSDYQATNHDVCIKTWENLFSRKELRDLAEQMKIKRGRDKFTTALHIQQGNGEDGNRVTFPVKLAYSPSVWSRNTE